MQTSCKRLPKVGKINNNKQTKNAKCCKAIAKQFQNLPKDSKVVKDPKMLIKVIKVEAFGTGRNNKTDSAKIKISVKSGVKLKTVQILGGVCVCVLNMF